VLASPENRNAFSAAMRDALLEPLVLAEVDGSIEEIDVSADGPVFSSGGDLGEFGTARDVVRAHQILIQAERRGRVGSARAARHRACARDVRRRRCGAAGVRRPSGRPAGDDLPLAGDRDGVDSRGRWAVSISRRIGRQATALLAILGEEVDTDRARALGLVDAVATPH
jgi:enoyl-CoA hydratase/carnithine racemase